MKSDTFQKLQELMNQIQADADKAFDKKVVARARAARKSLSELARLSKTARQELLDVIHEKKDK
jgi:ribosomal protein S20